VTHITGALSGVGAHLPPYIPSRGSPVRTSAASSIDDIVSAFGRNE